MANRHYGRIGDVWKHLPLLEILALESPREYWETHSGAALYPLTHSADRDFGVYYFVEHASSDPILGKSHFLRTLTEGSAAPYPHHYPGSADFAMRQLGGDAHRYLFCEIDRYSVQTLQDAADVHGLARRTRVIEGDGMDGVWGEIADRASPTEILVHIDPFDPFHQSPTHRLSALDLARKLSDKKTKVFYWYGFDEPADAGWAFDEIAKDLQVPVWYGEISVNPDGPKMLKEGILLGCGIVCTNLDESTTTHLADLGRSVEKLYQDARLPAGASGALTFTSGSNLNA